MPNIFLNTLENIQLHLTSDLAEKNQFKHTYKKLMKNVHSGCSYLRNGAREKKIRLAVDLKIIKIKKVVGISIG